MVRCILDQAPLHTDHHSHNYTVRLQTGNENYERGREKKTRKMRRMMDRNRLLQREKERECGHIQQGRGGDPRHSEESQGILRVEGEWEMRGRKKKKEKKSKEHKLDGRDQLMYHRVQKTRNKVEHSTMSQVGNTGFPLGYR